MFEQAEDTGIYCTHQHYGYKRFLAGIVEKVSFCFSFKLQENVGKASLLRGQMMGYVGEVVQTGTAGASPLHTGT